PSILKSGRKSPTTSLTFESASIFHEAFDLDFQLNNIFIAAEIEAGESPVGVANIEVESFINRTIKSFSHKIEEKELKVEFNCAGDEGFIFKTDPLKLQAIVMNIMANAVEFCLKGKSIKVTAEKKNDALVISIEDHGKGIANDEKERIFDRFKQLEAGSRKEHRGHGLGLSIVKSLLTQLGGHIAISGVAGEGCAFTVTIPDFQVDSEVDVFSEEGNEFIFGTEEEF
ncbi:MAG TPA: HAMP domain-containing histidine kinase, partial [Nitrospirae bacterium]|nr:HAMP domain-containing histidine kinase [Nitrospirota bacterium]